MTTGKPASVLVAYIPDALRKRRAWVVWRMEERDGRMTKVPYSVNARARAKSDDPSTWGDFSDALLAYKDFDGVGIMLAGGEYTCIDLDHCVTDGVVDDWAEQIVAKVDSYTETSQSGEGLHIFVLGTPPKGRRRKGTIEMYGPDDNRYIAVTGRRVTFAAGKLLQQTIVAVDLAVLHAELFPYEEQLSGRGDEYRNTTISPTLTDEEVYGKVYHASNAANFAAIAQDGPETAAYASPSEARMACISILAFYTQDADQLVSLAEQNGFDRPDDERKMRNHDIPNALASLHDTWQPPTQGIGRIGAITPREAMVEDVAPTVAFPFDTLPVTLRTLASKGGAASGCAPEAIAVHGLSVLGAAIGSTATVKVGSWRQRPVIWTAAVARAGTAKSTALNIAKAPLEAADALAASHARDMASDGKTVATARRTLADDATAEKLALMLQTYPRGLLVAADELAGVVTGMNQYKGGKGNDRQLYLKLWSGSALRVDRISRDPIYVAAPICAVTGAIQPARVDLLSGDDGMTGRWLVAYLEDRDIVEPTDADLTFEARAWGETVTALLSRQGDVEYALSDDAYAAFRAWRREIIEQTNAEKNPQRADYLGKLQSHMVRLVLLLHVADDPQTHSTIVATGTVARARRLLDYFIAGALAHIVTSLADPGRSTFDKLDKAADEIRAWLAHPKNRKAGRREAQQAKVAGLRTSATFALGWARYEEIYGKHA